MRRRSRSLGCRTRRGAYARASALMLQARYPRLKGYIAQRWPSSTNSGYHLRSPHVEWSLAAAELGLRHFARCAALLRKVEQSRQPYSDPHVQLNVRALRARMISRNGDLKRPSRSRRTTSKCVSEAIDVRGIPGDTSSRIRQSVGDQSSVPETAASPQVRPARWTRGSVRRSVNAVLSSRTEAERS